MSSELPVSDAMVEACQETVARWQVALVRLRI